MKIKGLKNTLVSITLFLYLISGLFSQETAATTTTTPTSIQTNLTLAEIAFSDDQLNLKATGTLIPVLQNLTSANADVCILKLKPLLSYMSDAEQLGFYNAYVTAKINSSSSENSGRCFAPGQLKQYFKKVTTGNAKQFSTNLGQQSKQLKNSFSCLKKSLNSIKSNASIDTPVNDFVTAQANANQCLSNFLKTLMQTLAARRRYLLLSINDQSALAISSDNYNTTGFPYLNSEVEQITKSFISFAECYQALPDTLTKSFSEALAVVADDPSCTSTTTAKRALQSATVNGTVSISAPGNVTLAIPNATLPLVIISNTSQTQQQTKKPKTKSMGTLVLNDTLLALVNAIIANYQTKSDNYITVANNLNAVKASTELKSKCNLAGQFNSYVQNPSDNLVNLLKLELSKLRKNTPCSKADYIILLRKQTSSSKGSLSCTDAESNCQNEDNVSFKNSDNTEITVAYGCSAGTRFSYAYSVNPNLGNFFDLNASSIKACKKGETANCAKQIANMNLKLLMRFLQGKNAQGGAASCIPAMQKGCSDTVSNECKNTNLLDLVALNAPSESDNPLPDACANIDSANPDYKNCFNWINNNLIMFTLFPNIDKIKNLPATINASQSATVTTLRYLQSGTTSPTAIIVTEDPSTKDTTAQIGADLYTVTDADLTIDGANPSTISADAYNTAAITGTSSNTQSYLKVSFLFNVLFCFVLIFI